MRVADLVASLRDDLGLTLVLIEHDMSVVLSIRDRVSVLNRGSVIATGTPELADMRTKHARNTSGGEQQMLAIASRHYILDEGRIVADVTTDRLRDDDELRRTYLGV